MSEIRCSFCEKSHNVVDRVISSPGGNTYIPNECVYLCLRILEEDSLEELKPVLHVTKPKTWSERLRGF